MELYVVYITHTLLRQDGNVHRPLFVKGCLTGDAKGEKACAKPGHSRLLDVTVKLLFLLYDIHVLKCYDRNLNPPGAQRCLPGVFYRRSYTAFQKYVPKY